MSTSWVMQRSQWSGEREISELSIPVHLHEQACPGRPSGSFQVMQIKWGVAGRDNEPGLGTQYICEQGWGSKTLAPDSSLCFVTPEQLVLLSVSTTNGHVLLPKRPSYCWLKKNKTKNPKNFFNALEYMAAVVRSERLAQSRFIRSFIPQLSVDINAPKYFTVHLAVT